MFTGIIETVGTVRAITTGPSSCLLTIAAAEIMDDVKCGDSISVNGVCLTVTKMTAEQFCADVMPETMRRSTLGSLKTGSRVNLERAMPANGRFGGHIVSGHIDGTGMITSIRNEANAVWFVIRTEPKLLRYIVEKGSIAIEGISLTVAAVTANSFSVSVIPHTAANTTLAEKRIRSLVNLENDCIGKYVEKLMGQQAPAGGITKSKLANYGF